MQRQKVIASSPRYPSRRRFAPARKSLACAGLLLFMVAAPGCPGDIAVPIDGDVAIPSETFFVSLPEVGSRTLHFDDGGSWVDFHVELVVDNHDLSRFLSHNAPGLLDRIERLLADTPPTGFDEIEIVRELEGRIKQLLADEWTGGPEAPVWNFIECTLVIDELGFEEPIDGDMP
jgi:hypothetical protein